MEEGRGACCQGCGQPCSLIDGDSCCPQGCTRCIAKKCSTEGKCLCNFCNCGCERFIKEKKKSCKDSGCPDCVGLCIKVQPGEKCLCSTCRCGCEDAFKKNKLCYDECNKCPECPDKCRDSKDGTCICYLCSCGCNGVNCQCCRRCNPETKCPGTCDTEEKHDDQTCPKGMCEQKGGSCAEAECICKVKNLKDHYEGECICKCKCGGKCPRIICAEAKKKGTSRMCVKSTKDDHCDCKCACTCNAIGRYYNKNGEPVGVCSKDDLYWYGIGKCRFKCTNCGRLCDQDRCMNWIRVIVIGLIILASLFVLRAIFPEKFRAIMTKIRATFASSPVHSGRSLNNLVGRKIPEDVNVDRYPAFRPRAYAGLA